MSSFEENIKDNTSSSAAAATGTTDLEESIDNLVLHGSKNVSELMAIDAEDESLRKYKETLLGSAAHGDLGEIEVFIIMYYDDYGDNDDGIDYDNILVMMVITMAIMIIIMIIL
jgi:hypothetical protein